MKTIALILILIFSISVNSKPPLTIKYVGLKHVGVINTVNDEGTQYEKNFYFSETLKAKPLYARSVCKSYGPNMDIASFENRDELQRIKTKLSMEMNQNDALSDGAVIGGFSHVINGRSSHFWITSGLKVAEQVDSNTKGCMAIKKSGGNLIFAGVFCEQEYHFICQDLEFIYAN